VLKSNDIPHSRPAIGRRIRDLINADWPMSRHENPPPKSN
jgi:hypothetical protein